MRKKSEEEELPQPHTRRVILIKDTRQQPDLPQSTDKGFIRNVEYISNQNSNTINKEISVGIDIHPKVIEPTFNRVEERAPQNFVPSNQMELIVGSLLQLSEEVSSLMTRLDILETKFTKMEEKADIQSSHSKKKLRRRAQEINKNFLCPEKTCNKAYGSEVSLNLHLRLKHPNRARQSQAQKEKEKEREKSQKALRQNSNRHNSNQNPEPQEQF